LQEPNSLGSNPAGGREDIMKGAATSAHDVKKLQQYLKSLKQLQKGLKAESDQYKILEKDAKKLEGTIKRLVRSKTGLTKAAEALTTKLGASGVGGGITQFSAAAVDASTSVNQLDGSMNVFGKSMKVSATTFAGWVSAVQLAIAVVVKLAEVVDQAQVKQANLQRSFGASNVSIRESFNSLAAGWKTAGAAGAEAAPKLNEAIRAARGQGGGDLMKEMGGATGSTFKQLVKYDVAFPVDIADKIKELAETFNIRSAGGINDQVESLLATIKQSGLPMERYGNMIFELAKTFATVGVTAISTADAFSVFENAVNKGFMTMELQSKMVNLAMGQQLTAGGFQGRVLTAAFAQEMSAEMDPTTIEKLDEITGAKYGAGKKFADISAYEASNVLSDRDQVSEGLYVKAMEGSYKKLLNVEKASGFGAAEQTAQAIGIPSWREFKKAGPALASGEMSFEDLQNILMTADERMFAAAEIMGEAASDQKDIAKFANEQADLNQQWYSDFAAFWTTALGFISETLGGGKKTFEFIQDVASMGMAPLARTDAMVDIMSRAHGSGKYSQESIASENLFKEKHGGISTDALYKYFTENPNLERPMYVDKSIDLEEAKGKLQIDIRYEPDGPSPETAAGTLGTGMMEQQ